MRPPRPRPPPLLRLLLLALTLVAGQAVHAQTTSFEFADFSDVSPLTLTADAAVVGTDAALRLTPSARNRRGSAFTTAPIPLRAGGSFQSAFRLRFTGQSESAPAIGGDGLVFVLQTGSPAAGTADGIGYQGIPNSLGVEFDTARDRDADDPSRSHVGVNVGGSPRSVATRSTLDAPLRADLDDGDTWHAWVEYDGPAGVLEVRLSTAPDRPADPFLTAPLDLSAALGPGGVYAGFTSATGRAVAAHDVLAWSFSADLAPPGPPALALTTPARVLWPLDTAGLAVYASDAVGLYGLRVDLGFDGGRLAYDEGSLASGTLFADGAPQRFAQSVGPDRLEIATGRTDGTAPVRAGTTATLSLTARDAATPGPVDLTLSGVDAVDPAGDAYPVDAVSGTAVVVGGVWPGDTDNDCDVDVFDILPVGRAFNDEGPARPGPRDLSWGAKAFSPWGGSSASDDFPTSFVDADGSGRVDRLDRMAVRGNLGRRRGPDTGCTPPPDACWASGAVEIPLDAPVGTTLSFELAVPTETTDLLGTGLSLHHGATGATVVAIEPVALMDGAFGVVWIRETVAQAAFTHEGQAEAVSGTGGLVRVTVRVNAPRARLALTGVAASSVDEGVVEVDVGGGSVEVSPPRPVSTAEGPVAVEVALAPNPARSRARLALVAPEAGEVSVSIYDALGRRVASVDRVVAAGATEFALPVSRLAPGLYVVWTQVGGQVVSRTLTVAR